MQTCKLDFTYRGFTCLKPYTALKMRNFAEIDQSIVVILVLCIEASPRMTMVGRRQGKG